MDQFPETELLIVPIGGGGLISGVSMAAKSVNPGSGSSEWSRPAHRG